MLKNIYDLTKNDLIQHLQVTAHIAELKEWDNRKHLERIQRYCFVIASEIGLPTSEIEAISLGSILHDIGKVIIPDKILVKPGFNAEDLQIIAQHTTAGRDFLAGSNAHLYQTAATIAYTHHERWDGSGYPQGISHSNIPLSGRICSLADVFDALTTNRPYKKALMDFEALQLIQDSKNTLFDPEVVNAFTNRIIDILNIKRRFFD